mgnify:CR=1 FL=1
MNPMENIEAGIDWGKALTAKDASRPQLEKRPPNYDAVISRIAGKPVLATDPQLLRLVIKYKKSNNKPDEIPDNHLNNPRFLMEVKKIFN